MNDDIREKKLQLLELVDKGEMTEAEARDLSGRLEAQGSAVYIKERPVINEQHPKLSTMDRTLFKNVSLNEEQGLNELQKRNPDLRFSFKNGEVVVRGQDEEDWRKIEPNNMGFNYSGQGGLKEFGKDALDVMYDVPAAAFETVATVGGGIAGGLATAPAGGVGALPGAMGAGAAAGATTETGRQALGNLTGFAEGYDGSQIGTSAAFGGLSPLAFGSGATAKGVLKSMSKKGLTQNMTEEAAEKMAQKVAQAQRSLITRGVGNATMWTTNRLGAWASGYTPETLQKLRTRMSQGLMDIDPNEVARGFRADLMKAREAKKEVLSKAYGESLEALDVAIDTGKVEQPLLDLLTEYEKRAEKAVPGFRKKMEQAAQAEEGVKLLDASGNPLELRRSG